MLSFDIMLSLYCDNFSILIHSFVMFLPNLAYDSVLIHIKSAVIFRSNKICKALCETSNKKTTCMLKVLPTDKDSILRDVELFNVLFWIRCSSLLKFHFFWER